MATYIVNHTGAFDKEVVDALGNTYMVNPVGYQNVLIFTVALYIIAFLLCLILVKPTKDNS